MTLFVDADSCPAEARVIIERRAARERVRLVYAANRPIPFQAASAPHVQTGAFTMEICPAEEGAADDRIVLEAAPGDIVVTRDVPLAARLLEKGAAALDDRGRVFTPGTIRHFLSLRDINIAFACLGGDRSPSYGAREKKAFADALDRLFTERRRAFP